MRADKIYKVTATSVRRRSLFVTAANEAAARATVSLDDFDCTGEDLDCDDVVTLSVQQHTEFCGAAVYRRNPETGAIEEAPVESEVELDSPSFTPAALVEFAAAGFVRRNRREPGSVGVFEAVANRELTPEQGTDALMDQRDRRRTPK